MDGVLSSILFFISRESRGAKTEGLSSNDAGYVHFKTAVDRITSAKKTWTIGNQMANVTGGLSGSAMAGVATANVEKVNDGFMGPIKTATSWFAHPFMAFAFQSQSHQQFQLQNTI